MKAAIGVDIGGTNTKVALVFENGDIQEKVKFSTDSHLPFEDFIQRLSNTIQNILAKTGAHISGIGVGAPNVNGHNGKIESPPNLKWGTVDLRSSLQALFDCPIIVKNDANIAAIGEQRFGKGKDCQHFAVITLGTGVGSGIISHGELIEGHLGLASEAGHIYAGSEDRICSCGKKDHLEAYASIKGIKLTVRLETGEDLLFREIAARFEQGDKKIIKSLKKTSFVLAQGLASIQALFLPEKIILAGGISSLGKKFSEDIEKNLNELSFPSFKGKTSVEISDISTEYGAILGAAGLVF